MATVRTPHLSNQSRNLSRSSVKVVKVRTGLGSASQGTATWSAVAPMSMPAALGLSVGSWELALAVADLVLTLYCGDILCLWLTVAGGRTVRSVLRQVRQS